MGYLDRIMMRPIYQKTQELYENRNVKNKNWKKFFFKKFRNFIRKFRSNNLAPKFINKLGRRNWLA